MRLTCVKVEAIFYIVYIFSKSSLACTALHKFTPLQELTKDSIMLTSNTDFKNLVKKEAEQLFLAFKIAIKRSDSITSFEPSLTSPSLQQCHEIISQAYGFNSYNGLLNSPSYNDASFNTKKLNDSMVSFVLQANINESSGVCEMIELMLNIDALDIIIADVNSINLLLRGSPSLACFKLPKRFYGAEFIFDDNNSSKAHIAIWMLSLLVDYFDSLDHMTRRNSEVYAIPLNIIYKHKVSDLNKVRDIVIDLEELLNQSGLVNVSMGEFDLIDHHLSKVNFSVSRELSKHLNIISKLIRNEGIATTRLNSFLDQLNHPESAVFNSQLHTAYLAQRPLKRLSGSNIVKYKLNSFFFFRVYLNHINDVTGQIHSYVDPNSFMPDFVFEDNFIEEAISQFNKKYDKCVLPFIAEYMKHQVYVIHKLKPLLNSLTSGKLAPQLSDELKEELSAINIRIKAMLDEMRDKLMSDRLKRRIEELVLSIRIK